MIDDPEIEADAMNRISAASPVGMPMANHVLPDIEAAEYAYTGCPGAPSRAVVDQIIALYLRNLEKRSVMALKCQPEREAAQPDEKPEDRRAIFEEGAKGYFHNGPVHHALYRSERVRPDEYFNPKVETAWRFFQYGWDSRPAERESSEQKRLCSSFSGQPHFFIGVDATGHIHVESHNVSNNRIEQIIKHIGEHGLENEN